MQSKLNKLRSKIRGNKSTINTEIYVLAKELGCLPDLIGREYVFVYTGKKITGFKQKPMPIPTFICLMEELSNDIKRQNKAMKSKGKGKGRR